MKKILALFVAFGETMRPKHRKNFGRMQLIKCADVQVYVRTHDDFRFCRELVEKSVKGVEEAEIPFVVACLCAQMVNGGKNRASCLLPCFPCTFFPTQSLLANVIFMLMNCPANLPLASVVIGGQAPAAFQPSW